MDKAQTKRRRYTATMDLTDEQKAAIEAIVGMPLSRRGGYMEPPGWLPVEGEDIFDPAHDQEAICARLGCGHEYGRHFDWMEDHRPGCKYCGCPDFVEPEDAATATPVGCRGCGQQHPDSDECPPLPEPQE